MRAHTPARATSKQYKLVSKTDAVLVFEDGKDINTAILLILGILPLPLVGAIIYYLLATRARTKKG